MKLYKDNNSSDRKVNTLSNLDDSVEDKKLPSANKVQNNSDLQKEQTLYLNRFLEAYGDCV